MQARTFISTIGLSEADWLAARTKGIGGSDVAAICGLSPYKSAVQVYLEKIGAEIDQEENSAMRWGKLLEPVIAEQFSRETGMPIRREASILQHPENDWALANLDFLITPPDAEEGILEVKNTSAYLAQAWEDNEAPQHYIMQLQWYLYVTGLKWGYFAPLIGGNRLLIDKRVETDLELVQPMVKICADFWTMVQLRTPPAPDGSDASTGLLKSLYPNSAEGKITVVSEDLALEIMRLPDLQEELKDFTKDKEYEIDTIKNKAKAFMQDAESASYEGKVLATWKTSSRAGYTVAPTTLRTFRIVKPKTKEKK